MYKAGKTLQEIGDQFNFTRSRSQQIVNKELKREILSKLTITQLSKEEKALLDFAASEETHEIAKKRKLQRKSEEIQKATSRIKEKMRELDHSTFTNVSSYAKALNEPVDVLEMCFPKIVNDITQRKKSMWSRHYTKCRNCGTTSVKHQSYGLCERCFKKSDIFKDTQSASRIRNIEKWRKAQRTYLKEYYKRPEVIAKNRLKQNLRTHGGNREIAIQRDDYKCKKCGISREFSKKKFGRDLYVCHIWGTKDHRVENLITICQECHNKNILKLMHRGIGGELD